MEHWQLRNQMFMRPKMSDYGVSDEEGYLEDENDQEIEMNNPCCIIATLAIVVAIVFSMHSCDC